MVYRPDQKHSGKGVTRTSGNSSNDGEGGSPGRAENGYVTADAYKTALEESVLLSSENERLKICVVELKGVGLVDGR